MKAVLTVKGMKCGGCESSIQDAVKACDGVLAVTANHRESTVEIDYEEGVANLDVIKRAIVGQGFELG